MESKIPFIVSLALWGLVFLYAYKRSKNGRFTEWIPSKPKVVFFPKYNASYQFSYSELVSVLEELKFSQSEENSNRFARGKVYGDFSINKILLNIDIDSNAKTFKIYCPSFMLFDTGETWSLVYKILHSNDLNKALKL